MDLEVTAGMEKPPWKCADLGDRYYYCMSPAGQWKYYYRYGTVSDCKMEWEDLKSCIKAHVAVDNRDKWEYFNKRKKAAEEAAVPKEHLWEYRDSPPEEFETWAEKARQRTQQQQQQSQSQPS
eukprot:Clim_evm98s128 gene=Clim_evmTU98s128